MARTADNGQGGLATQRSATWARRGNVDSTRAERGDVGGTWVERWRNVDWNRGPDGDLSGEQRQDFDRYAAVRGEEKKQTTLFKKRVVACRTQTRGTPASIYRHATESKTSKTSKTRKTSKTSETSKTSKASKTRPKRKQEPKPAQPAASPQHPSRPLAVRNGRSIMSNKDG